MHPSGLLPLLPDGYMPVLKATSGDQLPRAIGERRWVSAASNMGLVPPPALSLQPNSMMLEMHTCSMHVHQTTQYNAMGVLMNACKWSKNVFRSRRGLAVARGLEQDDLMSSAYRSLSNALGDSDFAKAMRLHGLAGSCFLAFQTPLCGYEFWHLLCTKNLMV